MKPAVWSEKSGRGWERGCADVSWLCCPFCLRFKSACRSHGGIAATGIMVFFLLGTFLDEAQVSYLKSAEAPAKQPLM